MPALDLSTARWRKSTRSDASNVCVEVAFLSTAWRKSTHSTNNANCVEVAHARRESTRSSESNTCVEVSFSGPAVGLRDSKNATGPLLALPVASFTTLVARLK